MTTQSQTQTASGGIGFFGLLTIVLVVLKATGYIDWSWWLVFSPILLGFALGALFIALFLLVMLIVAIKS
jgi:hypothetical protein